jgi:hypothetical protein
VWWVVGEEEQGTAAQRGSSWAAGLSEQLFFAEQAGGGSLRQVGF